MSTPALPTTGFELEFSLSLAAVPAWAPIGVDADDYRSHLLGTDATDPLPETLLHHQDRWGHVAAYDDFVELLPLDRFDPDDLASSAVDAGADTVIVTATSTDGWCWWDVADERSVVRRGPRRDVVGEMTAAAGGRGLAPGIRYDGTGRSAPDLDLGDLLDRYGIEVVSGSWPTDSDADVRRAVDAANVDIRVDVDRPTPAEAGWRTRHRGRTVADEVVGRPWVWSLPTGSGFGPNRADPPSRRLHPADLILRYAATSGRDGALRLVVPLTADGTVHDHDARLLRDVGGWIRCFGPMLRTATVRERWSDGTVVLASDDRTYAVVRGDCRLVPELTGDRARIVGVGELEPPGDAAGDGNRARVESDLPFEQDGDGLHLRTLPATRPGRTTPPDGGLPRVLLLDVATTEPPVQLFADEAPSDVPLAPLLDGRRPGEIVRLGDGPYVGPARVPTGVTVRGLGDVRTRVTAELTLEGGARLEHLHAEDVTIPAGADGTLILGCTIRTAVLHGDRATIRASRLAAVQVEDADGTTISRCRIAGSGVRATALSIRGGREHEVDACTITDVATAIDVADAEGPTVRGCTIRDVGTGVRLSATERAHVRANRVEAATRAVDVAGGLATLVDGNVVLDADSGIVVRDGATGIVVSGNYWERCRVGALLWEVEDVKVADNRIEALGEPGQEVRRGPS